MTREYREYAKSRIEYLLKICKLDERDKEALEAAIQALSSWEEYSDKLWKKAYERGKTEALSQEPCDDAISRDAVQKAINCWIGSGEYRYAMSERFLIDRINDLPPVTQKSAKDYLDMADRKAKKIKDALTVTQKSGKCKNCKYFEYDSVARVDGIPLIVAHEICNKWGDGCKTKEDGYCFLFEPQESEERNEVNY